MLAPNVSVAIFFEARVEGERHHCHETILRYIQKAPDDIPWEIDRNELHELMATKKESAPGPDEILYSLYRCAGGLGTQFSYNAYKHVFECGTVLALFAASRTVFHSQVLRCPQQWPYCEIDGGTSSVDTVIVIARFSPLRFAEAFNGTP